MFSGLYGNIQHLTVLSTVINLFKYNLNPQKTTTAKELTRGNTQRLNKPLNNLPKKATELAPGSPGGLGEQRARETLKLDAGREPACNSRLQGSAAAPSRSPPIAEDSLPQERGARTGSLLAPHGRQGLQGRWVNSPPGKQSRPQPGLPKAEVPWATHSSPTTLPRIPTKRLRFHATPGLHFLE